MIYKCRALVERCRQENQKPQRDTCPSANLSTTNPTWTDLGANPGLHCEMLATDHLSYGMAYKLCKYVQNVVCVYLKNSTACTCNGEFLMIKLGQAWDKQKVHPLEQTICENNICGRIHYSLKLL
jgi:hypothetical protein